MSTIIFVKRSLGKLFALYRCTCELAEKIYVSTINHGRSSTDTLIILPTSLCGLIVVLYRWKTLHTFKLFSKLHGS